MLLVAPTEGLTSPSEPAREPPEVLSNMGLTARPIGPRPERLMVLTTALLAAFQIASWPVL
jgi:hypothetical protein